MSDQMEITLRVGSWLSTREETYFGSCTVWHRVRDGKRASSGIEEQLSEIWNLRRYQARKAAERKEPDAP